MTHPRRRSVLRTMAALTVGAGLLAGGTVAQADTREELVEQREQVAAEQEELEASLEGVDSELAAIYVQLEKANDRLPEAEAALAEAENELAAAERTQQQVTDRLALAEAEAESLAGEISAAQDEITGSQDALGELARNTYRGGTSMGSLRVVLDASSTEEFMRQYTVLDTAVRAQTSVIDALEDAAAVSRNREARQQAVAERIAELKGEADAAVVDADAAREEAAARAKEIREIKLTQEELAAELEGRREVIEEDLSDAQATDTELAEEIARIDAENRRQEERQREAERTAREEAQRESRTGRDEDAASRGGAGTTSRPGGTDGLAFSTPVPNPLWVTSPYGMREHPLAGIWWMHDGVDLSSACGNPQYAVAAGTVADVRPAKGNGSHGNQVLVNHGIIDGRSYVTVYNHLSKFSVDEGDRVSKGEVLGLTGDTGNVTGCHVHFEVWRDGSTIDPMRLPGYIRAN